FTLVTDAGDIDLFGELPGVGSYEALLPRVEGMDIFGERTLIIGLDDLIRAKHAAGRPKDRIHLEELEEIKRRR
ncbi:MAG: hypothetical protein ACREQ9_09950, partial [Candidatus Binatia bacterium]